VICIQCGAEMVDRRGKSMCLRCGFYEACCEGECGRQVEEVLPQLQEVSAHVP